MNMQSAQGVDAIRQPIVKFPAFAGNQRHLTLAAQAVISVFMAACFGVAGSAQAATMTRTSAFDYDTASGLLTKELVEPGNSAFCVVTAYTLDAYGHRQVVTTRPCNGSAGSAPGSPTEAAAPPAAAAFTARSVSSAYTTDQRFESASTNALSQTENRTYDVRFGAVATLTDVNQLTRSVSYDELGRKLREQGADLNGTRWDYQYCSGAVAGGTLSCPNVAGATAAYAVTATPTYNSTTVRGPYVRTYHDALGRVIRSETQGSDVSGASALVYQDTQYDDRGQVLKVSRPYYAGQVAYWTTYAYDTLGRVKTIDRPTDTAPSGASTRTTYSGLTTTVTDPLGYTTVERKDPSGRLSTVTDTKNGVLTRGYDPFGNLVRSEDARGNVISIVYDAVGRNKVAMYDPDMGVWAYCYDALGQLKAQQSSRMRGGHTVAACPANTGTGTVALPAIGWTTVAYDLLGRMTQRVEPDATSTWSFDKYADQTACGKGVGKLCEQAGANSFNRKIAYDAYGRPNTATSTVGSAFTTTTTYDTYGRPDVQTYPSGLTIKQTYTPGLGYLKQVQDNRPGGTVLWTANAMDAEGRLTQQVSGNGVVTNTLYFAGTGRLSTAQAGPGNSVVNLVHNHDATGRLTGRYDLPTGLNATYGYDELNRLTSETRSGAALGGSESISWAYDAIGNISARTQAGVTHIYNYNSSGSGSSRPHAVASVSGSVSGVNLPLYTYDLNGNVASGAGRTIGVTSFDNVASLVKGSARLDYLYDTEHERAQESYYLAGVLQRSTVYVNPPSGSGLLYEEESGAAGSKKKHYISAGGNTVAMIVCTAAPCTSLANSSTQYWHEDHLGSVSVVTNSAGAVIERMAYEPFGKRRNSNGLTDVNGALTPSSTDRGYTEHEHLDEVGLINMNGRVYDPGLARFVSPDPHITDPGDLQSYNRYSYVRNNPMGAIDPSGFVDIFLPGSNPTTPDFSFDFNFSAPSYFQSSYTQSYQPLVSQYFGAGLFSLGALSTGSFGASWFESNYAFLGGPNGGGADFRVGARGAAAPAAAAGAPGTAPLSDRDWAGALAEGLDKFGQFAISATGAPGVEVAGGLKVLSTMLRGIRLGEAAAEDAAVVAGSIRLAGVPGRVGSRINLSNEGMEHVISRHLSGKANASQFSLSEAELRSVLSSRAAMGSPVVRTVESADGIRYVREFDAGRVIGTDRFSGNQATSVMTIMTDRFGNLISTFPGLLK